MKQKLLFSFIFLATWFLFLGVKGVEATNWYCPSPSSYFVCYYDLRLSNCEAVGCWDLDSTPDCNPLQNCECKSTTACGSYPGDDCMGAAGGWNYKYDGKCFKGTPDRYGNCVGQYYFKYKECSAADRCEDWSVGNKEGECGGAGGGTGSNDDGKILPGICSASFCPNEGCRNGWHYKTCCILQGPAVSGMPLTDSPGSCSGGGCASGVPVRWGDFSSPGPTCSTSLCLDWWDGYSWVVETCGSEPVSTPAPGDPTPTPLQPTPVPGDACGECGSDGDRWYECSGYGGCSVSVCEKITWGIEWPTGNCSPCFNKNWDYGCGAGSPAVVNLYSPGSGSSVVSNLVSFKWYRYQTGELVPSGAITGSCRACSASLKSQRFCWGYVCARGSYGLSMDQRKFELFVSRKANLTSSEAAAKNPDHWGTPRAIVDNSYRPVSGVNYNPELKVKGEDGYTTLPGNLVTREVDMTGAPEGTYWWFIRSCYQVYAGGAWRYGCTDTPLRSFKYSPCYQTPPDQPTCVSPNNTIVSETEVSLVWNPPEPSWGEGCPNTKSYEVYFSEEYPPLQWNSASLPVTDQDPPPLTKSVTLGKTYYWQVKAVNNGQYTYGNICSFAARIDPWWQAKDGDVHAQGDVYVFVPPDDNLMLDGDNGGQPGVVSALAPYGDINTDPGGLSSTDWQAKTDYATALGFEYLKNRLNIDTREHATLENFTDNEIPPSSGTETYYLEPPSGTLTIQGRTIGSQEKIIIFVKGHVELESNLVVEKGGFFALVANGNITFDSGITQAQGFFLADGEIRVLSSGGTDQVFEAQGSFIGRSGVSLQRDLGPAANVNNPAEKFFSRFDLLLNAPAEFRYSSFVFREVAP